MIVLSKRSFLIRTHVIQGMSAHYVQLPHFLLAVTTARSGGEGWERSTHDRINNRDSTAIRTRAPASMKLAVILAVTRLGTLGSMLF